MTFGFTATFGRVPGYAHNNEDPISLADFADKWQEYMQQEFDDTNILVGCVIHESKTVYPLSFGCPKGGEATITVSGHYNPKFIPKWYTSYDQLKCATKRICINMKQYLTQTTVSLTFHEIEEFVYLTNKEGT